MNLSESRVTPSTEVVQVDDTQTGAVNPSEKSTSRYWSYTFGLVSFPFVFWGCPFFVVTRPAPPKNPLRQRPFAPVVSTKGWIKRIFDFYSFPLGSFFALILLIPCVLFNAYVIYAFGDIFNHLFISGTYEMSMFHDFLALIRYLPVVVPLNYVWFRGYHVNTMIGLLNSLYSQYGGVGCGSVRARIITIIIIIGGIHAVRWYCYERYQFVEHKSFFEQLEVVLEFSVDLFSALLLPLYCTFCYAVSFQLLCVKAFIYRVLSQRIIPARTHLDTVKILYTQATNHIELINGMFSLYLSVALIILNIGTLVDSESLWRAIMKISGSSRANPTSPLAAFLIILAREVVVAAEDGTLADETSLGDGGAVSVTWTASEIRELNADFACIFLTYGLMAFTIWQAVRVNDKVREAHVWLNDFVTGGGGTDIKSVLLDMGGLTEPHEPTVVLVNHSGEEEGGDRRELVWGRNTTLENGQDDEFIKKFRMLKAYMHSRMQLEKPGLLNITLVGILVPPLSSRLRGYRLRF